MPIHVPVHSSYFWVLYGVIQILFCSIHIDREWFEQKITNYRLSILFINIVNEICPKPFIFQEFIDSSYGKDIRLNVVGDEVVASTKRVNENGDYRANVTNGGTMYPYIPSDEEKELAIKACKATKCDFAGVDILFGKNENSSIELDEAIKMADFEKDLAFLENGLDTIVGEYGVTLSGGQKQRLSIARALIKDAPILILDDSLSAVDGTTEANIIKNLKQIRNNKTNIIIAHRLTAVEGCDEIIVLDNGKISERGTHQELMNIKGWYHDQYVIQEMGGEGNDA